MPNNYEHFLSLCLKIENKKKTYDVCRKNNNLVLVRDIKSCMKDPDAEYVIEQKSVIKSLGRLCARCYFVPVTDGVRGNGYSLYIPLD